MTALTETVDAQLIDETDVPDEPPQVVDAEDVEPATPKSNKSVAKVKGKASKSDTERWLDAEKAWQTRFDPDWKYERIDFRGDYLAVRKPTQGTANALSTALTKYVPVNTQNNMIGLVLIRHLGPDSYDHFKARQMDPDDEAYNPPEVDDDEDDEDDEEAATGEGALIRAIFALLNPVVAE